ncbi:hypothetical protein AKO1_014974 [Acrasis kona]|uniref:Uncharacterized protein n=1 Tax=Acrasis kona TaxID=1008807 RepID=A0AAW2Z1C1_9EUKA
MKALTLLVYLAVAILSINAELFDESNNPKNFGKYQYKTSELPSEGEVKLQPWSDSYWPSNKAGIAWRWLSNPTNESKSFNYKLHDKEELHKLSLEELSTLSPAEKFDIYQGRYDYPTVKSEWKRTGPNDSEWEGLCHGWAPAAAYYKQPSPTEVKNSDGLIIPFGSSDVKALLTYYVALYMDEAETSYLGTRCNFDIQGSQKAKENTTACRDTNAGAFHVAIANEIGIHKRSFMADTDRSYEVWNQPVSTFNYTILGESIHNSTKNVHVLMDIAWATEIEPEWNAVNTTVEGTQMEYDLELDNQGNIIGGAYRTYERMDFLWNMKILSFAGYFKKLDELYQSSIGGSTNENAPDRIMFGQVNDVKNMNQDVGKFGINGYKSGFVQNWYIQSTKNRIRLTFNVNTNKQWDTIKVYEHVDGALLRVLYGRKNKEELIVNAKSAHVVFSSKREHLDGGFEAYYESIV